MFGGGRKGRLRDRHGSRSEARDAASCWGAGRRFEGPGVGDGQGDGAFSEGLLATPGEQASPRRRPSILSFIHSLGTHFPSAHVPGAVRPAGDSAVNENSILAFVELDG